jgi:hypothetical protein
MQLFKGLPFADVPHLTSLQQRIPAIDSKAYLHNTKKQNSIKTDERSVATKDW